MLIVADENIPLLAEFFADFGDIRALPGRHMTREDVKAADALLVRSVTPVNESLLTDSRVQFVASATIGTDHIDQVLLAAKDIGFANAPGCNAESVADYVVSALLNLAELKQQELSSKLIGVIGVGNVGSAVVRRLRSFGCDVICNDSPRVLNEGPLDGFVDLEELLTRADVVCMHAPLTASGPFPSYHLIRNEQLGLFKPDAWLVNAGRGAVIDNQALKHFLTVNTGSLEVVLDVWEPEPNLDLELLKLVRWGSPHIAGYSIEGRMRGTEMVYHAFCRHFGLPIEKSLQQFLPEAPALVIDEPEDHLTSGSLQSRVLDLVNQCYDLKGDDARLREVLTMESGQVGSYFDQLRREYPVRRQLSSSYISSNSSLEEAGELLSYLKVLGFNIND